MKKEWVLIFGDYINALTIIQSLKNIEWIGKVVCIVQQGNKKLLVDLIKGIEVWRFDFSNLEDVFFQISLRIPEEEKKYLVFTSEQFHEELHLVDKILPYSVFWSGDISNIELILDRYLFYSFIQKNSEAKVPKTIESKSDPFEHFSAPFFLRIRKSWSGVNRRKSVFKIETKEDLKRIETELINKGLSQAEWCYQEILSLNDKSNLSICGWHQVDSQNYFASHKILQHPSNTGNGDVVSIIEPPSELLLITEQILNALNYSGPFELEFVFDENEKTYKVIELNPRFWMQHGLIEANTEHELIRRYLQLEIKDEQKGKLKYQYWINSFYSLFRILKFDFRIMQYLFYSKKYVIPSLPLLWDWIPVYIKNKIR